MAKRILIPVLILVAVCAGFGIFWYMTRDSTPVADPIDAIPTSVALIIAYPDVSSTWQSFTTKEYYGSLNTVPELQRFFSRKMFIDSLLRHDADIMKMLSGATVWSSFHPAGADSMNVFHVAEVLGASDSDALNTLKRILNPFGVVSEQMIGEVPVSKLVLTEPYDVVYYTAWHGLVLTSTDIRLMRTSLKQLRSGSTLRNDPYFMKAEIAAGKHVDADVYVNYAEFPPYLGTFLKTGLGSVSKAVGRLADWSEIDLTLLDDGFMFNGFTHANDSLPRYLNILLNQQPQPIDFPDILPANTASFLFFGIDDVILLSADYRKYLKMRGRLRQTETTLDSLNVYYGVDFEQNLMAWLGNEFGICVLEPESATFADKSFAVCKARSAQLARKLLGDLSRSLADKKGVEQVVLDVQGFQVTKLELSGILSELFGHGLDAYESLFYVIVNDYVIFGTDPGSMADYLDAVKADRTLGKQLAFSDFTDHLSSSYNMFSYHHLERCKHVMESYLNRETLGALKKNHGTLDDFEAVGTQMTTTGQSFYSNMFIKYDPRKEESEQTFWKARMGNADLLPPVLVKNHLNNDREILAQDASNTLYLFNRFGKELFKLDLPEPILSRPVQVDAFRNGNLQYVFNTENFIYLIDREGKIVKPFPIKLAAAAQTALSVIEYDRKRDYRLLIACANKHVYNYSIKGNRIKGWHHGRTSDQTVFPFSHLLINGKDYLITGESNGRVHLLDRRGKNRVTVEKHLSLSKKNKLQAFSSPKHRFDGIYMTDSAGTVQKVFLDGKVSLMDMGRFSPEHEFVVSDLDKDGYPEFIFVDLNMLRVFDHKKQKLFEQRIDPSASRPFIVDLGKQGMAIGFCFSSPQQLVLYGNKGGVIPGFPLSGSSVFDLETDGNTSIVVCAEADSSLSIQLIR